MGHLVFGPAQRRGQVCCRRRSPASKTARAVGCYWLPYQTAAVASQPSAASLIILDYADDNLYQLSDTASNDVLHV